MEHLSIWAGVIQVNRQYGRQALEIASMRCETLLAEQDHEGYAIWRQIHEKLSMLGQPGPTPPSIH
ncbi:hypothetical protein [Sandarakinorhabdus sp. DWP1-3-1]|uniref:hypothetical protein n=1 Tax=Sandarakinorhabdus sp. DWP1-3-1 TaxID=2804627 RepID=UPI003CE9FF44